MKYPENTTREYLTNEKVASKNTIYGLSIEFTSNAFTILLLSLDSKLSQLHKPFFNLGIIGFDIFRLLIQKLLPILFDGGGKKSLA